LQISPSNSSLVNALKNVYTELAQTLGTQLLSRSGRIMETETWEPLPDGSVNGLQIVDLSESGTNLTFRVRNTCKRWISIYIDTSSDGVSFTTGSMADLMPSPEFSIYGIATGGVSSLSKTSRLLQSPLSGIEKIEVKCYGLGVGHNLPEEEFPRAVIPTVATGVFDLVVPMWSIITGVDMTGGPDLMAAPVDHPFLAMLTAVVECLGDPGTAASGAAQIYDAWREGDLVGLAVFIAKESFMAVLENPALIAQIIYEIAGEEIASSVVESYFFPLRVISAATDVVNLGSERVRTRAGT